MAAVETTLSRLKQTQEFILSRPILPTLETGFHMRNRDEALDLWGLVSQIPDKCYVGLAGSRQVGKILIPQDKLPQTVTNPLPESVVGEIVDRLSRIAERVHGCARIVRRPSRRTSVPPANAFIYDVDLVVIPGDPHAASFVEPRMGARSGTHFDLITVSQDALIRADGFFRSAFLNSRRLLVA